MQRHKSPVRVEQAVIRATGDKWTREDDVLAVEEPLKTGDTVALTLTFAVAPPLEITAEVGQPALTDSGHAAH